MAPATSRRGRLFQNYGFFTISTWSGASMAWGLVAAPTWTGMGTKWSQNVSCLCPLGGGKPNPFQSRSWPLALTLIWAPDLLAPKSATPTAVQRSRSITWAHPSAFGPDAVFEPGATTNGSNRV